MTSNCLMPSSTSSRWSSWEQGSKTSPSTPDSYITSSLH
jgi:hypothetical protein